MSHSWNPLGYPFPEPGRLAVYVITDGECCKIGVAGNPAKRLQSLQTGSWKRLSIAYVTSPIKGGRAFELEEYAHGQLADRRLVGEWFDCSPDEAISALQGTLHGPHSYYQA